MPQPFYWFPFPCSSSLFRYRFACSFLANTCISQMDTLMPFARSLSFYRPVNKTPVRNTSIYPYLCGPSLYLSPLERFASSCLFPLLLELALQWQPNTERYESAQGRCAAQCGQSKPLTYLIFSGRDSFCHSATLNDLFPVMALM